VAEAVRFDPATVDPAVRSRLRIAVVSLHTSPTASLGHSANGGLNVYVREVCAALSQRGVATDVFTRQLEPDGPAVERLASRSRVVYLPAGSPDLDKYRLLEEVPGFSRRLEAFLCASGQRYDLIYSHYWLSGLAACWLRGRLRLPWAHTAHTLAVVKNQRLAPGDSPEPEVRADLEGEIARCADLLVVSTPSEADQLRRAYGVRPDRLAAVAPGVDLDAFRPQPRTLARLLAGCPPDSRPFVFVGRLERLKGVDVILRALALLTAAHPEARLLVLGEDSRSGGGSGGSGGGDVSEKARLQEVARALGVADRVDFLGSVPQSRLADYYSAAEAVLLPSYNESFGLVGLEAQACGTAVVASTAAGLASVLRDGVSGFLVEGPDPAAYAERMRRLLEEPELAARMGRRGRRLAERFSWQRTADDLLARFEALVASQTGVQATARQE
jgi:D-inositol-3-phosphate glycosyltransferase